MAYTKPELRESIKNRIMSGSKGGNPGQWSARKAQLLAQAYEKAGGGYSGSKTTKQKYLSKWTKEKWGTKSGRPSTQGAKATGERYLPKKARESLTAKEYAATSRAKREGTSQGKQFVRQPKKIAKKTARYR
jgi:UTP:GlnB (protein PII) uridylyltransferase